jgi:hypothetical protein
MDNGDLLLLLGVGLAAVSLAVLLPPTVARPAWVNTLLGIAGAVLGVLVVLVVALR